MKRKEAIKRTREGVIQVFNDYHPSTKEIKKFLKEAFPDDDFLEKYPNEVDEISRRYFQKASYDEDYWVSSNGWKKNLPIIGLSTITKRKKTKLSQLEKQFSDLAKDVVELKKELLFTSVSCRNCEVVDAEELKSELIVGEWYKSIIGSIALFSKDEFLKGFAWDGIWSEKVIERKNIINENYRGYWTIASPQEVQTALKNEAKKRGYKNGAIINNSSIGFCFNELYLDTNLFEWDGTYLNIGKEKLAIFKDGIWAELIQQETIKEEIDWSVPQLVISDKGKIVATNGNNLEYSFEGMVVVSDILLQPVNHFYDKWGKLYFKPFKGELTIK